MRKYCIVTDWLDLYGGAERVVRKISEIYPIHEVYTLTDQRDEKSKELFFKDSPLIKSTSLQILGKKFRLAFPLFPYLISKLKINPNIDVIISSSFNVAKGIQKSSDNQVHICYIQTRNFKYIEDNDSLNNYFGKLKYFIFPFISFLKNWDIKSSKNPDLFIANSIYTQNNIRNKYGRDSVVVYPPVEIDNFTFNPNKENYYIAIGRFAAMKRFDLLIEAFNELPDKKLILVGDGVLMNKFKKQANKNIHFTGFLSSNKVNDLLQAAKACICVGIEDFGIAAVESQACGTPVIAYATGGTAETIINNKTGILFKKQNKNDIKNAINELENMSFDYNAIRLNASKYSSKIFKQNFRKVIDEFINL